jgi:hypothetical protein
MNKLRQTIPADQRSALLRDMALAPGWMQPFLRDLAAEQ